MFILMCMSEHHSIHPEPGSGPDCLGDSVELQFLDRVLLSQLCWAGQQCWLRGQAVLVEDYGFPLSTWPTEITGMLLPSDKGHIQQETKGPSSLLHTHTGHSFS